MNNIYWYSYSSCLSKGSVTQKAWVSDNGRARPKLQGTLESCLRERSMIGSRVFPTLDEEASGGLDVTPLTEYCVRRFVASHWANQSIVTGTNGRSLDHFLAPLRVLHQHLVESGAIQDDPLFAGSTVDVDDDEGEEDGNAAERLRLQALRNNDAARVQVNPLPVTYINYNANALSGR